MTSQPSHQRTEDQLHALGDAVGRFLGDGLHQGRAEMHRKARQSAPGLALLVGAGWCAAAAAATSTLLAVRLLDRVLPRPAAAALGAAGFAGGAALLASVGFKRLSVINPAPSETLETLRAGVESAPHGDGALTS